MFSAAESKKLARCREARHEVEPGVQGSLKQCLPVQVNHRSFTAIAGWALDTAFELCLHASGQPSVACAQVDRVAQQDSASLAARTLSWLASWLAPDASAGSPAKSPASDSSAAPAVALSTAAASISEPGHHAGCEEPAAGVQMAQRVVRLYFAMGPQLRMLTAPAAAFALAQLLQPDIGALLLGDEDERQQVRAYHAALASHARPERCAVHRIVIMALQRWRSLGLNGAHMDIYFSW